MMCWSHRNTHEGGSKEHRCLSLSACPSVCVRYVYHSDHIFPDPSYQNRVQYLGEPGSKVCSLRITDLRQSDSGTYVFYLITNNSTEKMPEQAGIQLLVAGVNLKQNNDTVQSANALSTHHSKAFIDLQSTQEKIHYFISIFMSFLLLS